jgi:hypothetical protein
MGLLEKTQEFIAGSYRDSYIPCGQASQLKSSGARLDFGGKKPG